MLPTICQKAGWYIDLDTVLDNFTNLTKCALLTYYERIYFHL